MSANSPVNISLDLANSLIFKEPVRNMDPFNSEAALRKGYAIALIVAPNAMHFAISRPFLIPPDAINGKSTAFLTSIRLKAVGIPQSQNNSPRFSLASFFTFVALIFSIPAQLVPPDPAILIQSICAFSNFKATSRDMPEPTSFTIIGMLILSLILVILSQTPLYFGSPSG